MSKKPEQIGKSARTVATGRSEARKIKKETRRSLRREEKRDPENAPTKTPYRGYVA